MKQTYWELTKNFIKQPCLDMLYYLGISSTMYYMCDDNDNCRHQCSCMIKISKLNMILYTCLCKFRPMGLYKFVCYMCDDKNNFKSWCGSAWQKFQKLNVTLCIGLCKFRPMGPCKFVMFLCWEATHPMNVMRVWRCLASKFIWD